MHIKELRVDGFKSFATPTDVPFYEGFTAISGPNGSGKSNLIDSILFALGLARTRGMRAEKLPDLLYNPPDGEPVREASVEVVLDNSDRSVSEEEIRSAAGELKKADEVVIKRRIKRTEKDYYSYYYINGRSVNLSDVRDLLGNAGITPEGYNVVMQGDVTNVVQMSSTERRGIVEEAAGTAEFDEKKEKAFDELDTVDERVERVELILDEIDERLARLKDERDKALEYRDLKEEKQKNERLLSVAKLQEVESEIEEVEQDIEEEKREKEEFREELEEREEELDELKQELKELNEEISRKGESERLELVKEIEELKAEVGKRRDRIEDAREAMEEFEREKREAFVGADKAREEIEEIESELRETKVTKSNLKSELSSKEGKLEELGEEMERVEGEYSDVREELDEAKEEAEDLRDEKNELLRRKDRLLDEARRRTREIEELEEDVEEARGEIEEAETELGDVEREVERAEANVEELEDAREDLREERDELQSDLEDVEESLRAKKEEYAQEQARVDTNGGSYTKAVSAVLNSGIEGVHGTVADLGSVVEKYATACETAAGGRMAHVVVDDDGVGQECIEMLKRRNAGRATMLPLTKMNERRLPSLPERDGVIDFAYNLVDFDPEYSAVFSYVLGDTVVVDDLDTARSLMGEYRLVTLEGDLVEKSGAMTGGSKSGSRYSFGSKGALERLADRIEELEGERRSLKDDIADVNGRLDTVGEKLEEAREEARKCRKRRRDIEDRVEELEKEIEDKEDRLGRLREQRSEKRGEMEEVEDEIEEKQEVIEELEDRIEELKADLEGSRVSELNDRVDDLQDEINDLRDRVRDVDSEINELELEKGYKEDKIEEYEEKIRELDEKRDRKEDLIDELEEEIEGLEEDIEGKEEEVAEIEDEIGELKHERDALEQEVEEAVESRDEVRREIERCSDRIRGLRRELGGLREEAEELREEASEVDVEETPDYAEIENEIERLDSDMEELEPVNMLAIEEYEEVSEREDDLQERKETLMEEKGEIMERIEKYEEMKREAFMEAFTEIDEHFQEIFTRLSDGHGELVLEDPEEPFESGMTIKANPGDKPVKHLEAMSGGERSLTALSFIFAIQRFTPAPFYAFDEIDMFLDAPNAERVAEMISNLADDTQFIVVSLRTPMIERAERTVGVTMQEGNVSTVTGVMNNDGSDGERVEAD